MKVRYTGNGYNLNNVDHYEVVDTSTIAYKIRNDMGKLDWYVKSNFIEVKEKVSKSETNSISPDLIKKIEKELNDAEQRMADLRQQLEDAKNPPTKNILLRATRKDPNWMDGDVLDHFDSLVEALMNDAEFPEGLAMGINMSGDGINLDSDYRWELTEDDYGCSVLMVFDK
jgi:hypothetical protein